MRGLGVATREGPRRGRVQHVMNNAPCADRTCESWGQPMFSRRPLRAISPRRPLKEAPMSVHAGAIFCYPAIDYPFATRIGEAVRVGDLWRLHEFVSYALFRRETDQETIWHERYYGAFNSHIAPVYVKFLTEIIAPRFDEPMAYQRIPNFRVHLPDNVAVGEFHRDRDYGHPQGETNFLLPLTDASNTSTIWIESTEGADDFRPINLRYGELFCFDGLNLRHGNKINETGATRVSLDFRVIPLRLGMSSTGVSVNTRARFSVGHYYVALNEIGSPGDAGSL